MEYLADFGLFFAKFATLAAGFLLLALAFIVLVARGKRADTDRIEVKHLNKKLDSMRMRLKSVILPPKSFKKDAKAAKQDAKASMGSRAERKRVFVCRFKGDLRASAVNSLREEITAILTVAKPVDEVVVIIDSSGGTIQGYGLAASQLQRVRKQRIRLTAAVDKVAASGGYMMACVADQIIAAPFAILGSIGVIAQLPNFNRLLKKHDIDFEQITAGRYKRTLTLFGENTDADRHKFKEEIEDAHQLFKEFVAEHRPQIDLDVIATGEYWFGTRAIEKKLVDVICTSDDYLSAQTQTTDVFEVRCSAGKHWYEKLFAAGSELD